jgi:hypothetical protein
MLLRRWNMKHEPGGIDIFRDKVKDYKDYYTIIGGTACDILLSEADLRKRDSRETQIIYLRPTYDRFTTIVKKCKET